MRAFALLYRINPTESHKHRSRRFSRARLLDFQHFDVEDQGAVSWNTRHGLAAIGQVCWDGQSALAADGHASNADIPTLNNLPGSELERKWFALRVCFMFISTGISRMLCRTYSQRPCHP